MRQAIKVMRGTERTILDCIFEGTHEFYVATGRNPTRIHIGPEKAAAFQEMMEEAVKMCCVSGQWKYGHKPKHVAMYNGLEIYRQTRPGMVIE